MNFCDGRYTLQLGIAITAKSLGKGDNLYGIDTYQVLLARAQTDEQRKAVSAALNALR